MKVFSGKTETFGSDTEYMYEKLNLTSSIKKKFNTAKSRYGGVLSSKDRTRNCIRQLKSGLRKKLVELYKLDFEMFGYSPEEYL